MKKIAWFTLAWGSIFLIVDICVIHLSPIQGPERQLFILGLYPLWLGIVCVVFHIIRHPAHQTILLNPIDILHWYNPIAVVWRLLKWASVHSGWQNED